MLLTHHQYSVVDDNGRSVVIQVSLGSIAPRTSALYIHINNLVFYRGAMGDYPCNRRLPHNRPFTETELNNLVFDAGAFYSKWRLDSQS